VGNNLVAWMSRKQASIFLSTVEAKFVSYLMSLIPFYWFIML
jgi:hypothetical protein